MLEHVRDALARDPRTGELGLEASIENDALVVRGVVGSEERRVAVLEVAREAASGLEVINQTQVKEVRPPSDQESIP